MNRRHKLGIWAEQRALLHLQAHGLLLCTQNYTSRYGEIDLVMLDGDVLVFVEVRLRAHASRVDAFESVDEHKQRRIILTAMDYLQNHPLEGAVRFDAVLVCTDKGRAKGFWIQDAFDASFLDSDVDYD